MKRRLVLRETPIKTKKKGKVVTVQNVENILILNMYRDKDLTCRYCMNTDTGEYETWDAKTGEWSVMKAHRAAGGLDWYDNGRSVEKTLKYFCNRVRRSCDDPDHRGMPEGTVHKPLRLDKIHAGTGSDRYPESRSGMERCSAALFQPDRCSQERSDR